MYKLFLRFAAILGVLLMPCMVFAVTEITSETANKTQTIIVNGVAIQYSKMDSLVFNGIPNETKTGEATFSIKKKPGDEKFWVTFTGTNFQHGNSILKTQYQPQNTDLWYKAGESIKIVMVAGQNYLIRYQAVTGQRISVQQAGSYNAKLFIAVTPYQ